MQEQFEQFLQAYPGAKRDSDTEFANLVIKHRKDWREVVPKLYACLQAQIDYRKQAIANGKWMPEWPYLSNYIADRRWELTYETKKEYYCHGCGQQVQAESCYSEGGKVYCTSKCKY